MYVQAILFEQFLALTSFDELSVFYPRIRSFMSFQTTNRIIVILVGDLIPKRHMLFLDPHQIGEPYRLHVFESSFFHVSDRKSVV